VSQYEPEAENRGTCPVCDRRCKVRVPQNGDGSLRVCCWHRSPERAVVFGSAPVACHGIGMVRLEDRRGGLAMTPTATAAPKPIRVDVLSRTDGGRPILTIYELPGNCHRVVVDRERASSPVYGFCRAADSTADQQVDANLVWQGDGTAAGWAGG
jgi:hypothetical protein